MSKRSGATQRMYEWIEAYQIDSTGKAPTYREIADGLGYKSLSAVQYHLDKLETAGLIDRENRRSRSIRAIGLQERGIPIAGYIAAGGLVETFTEQEPTYVKVDELLPPHHFNRYFAVEVRGDSMINAQIQNGDIVVLEKPTDPDRIKDGTIVAARVGSQTTLKRWYRNGRNVTLKPENPAFPPIPVLADEVEVQGIAVKLTRNL